MEKFELPNRSENPLSKESTSIAPEGWRSNFNLATELGVDPKRLRESAKKYMENEGYFAIFKDHGKDIGYYSPELVEILKKEVESFERAPDGWFINTSLASELEISPGTLAAFSKKYRDNPEFFKKYINPSNKEVEYYSPELVLLLREDVKKFKEIPQAPEGWETASYLAKRLKTTHTTISKIAEEYKESNPEYFSNYKDTAKKVSDYLSPEIVKIIEEKVQKIKETPEPPQGWVVRSVLAEELDVTLDKLMSMAEPYHKSHPEYFHEYKSKNLVLRPYYSPELVELLRVEADKYKNFESAPEGWKTNSTVAQELEVDPATVVKFSKEYREVRPEFFKKYKNELIGRGTVEYYSPELIQLLQKEIGTRKEAPEGWQTKTLLARELGTTTKPFEYLIEEYRKTNPEYFAIYKDIGGNLNEHYSPELVEIIKTELSKHTKAPEGWVTKGTLANLLDTDSKTLTKTVENLREKNPEHFKPYRDKMGRINEHYSPELVALINKSLEKEREQFPEAPEGWENNYSLSVKLDVAPEVIRNAVKKYSSKPEYFAEYKGKTGVREFYSPELVGLLKKEIGIRLDAPFGWKTKTTLSKELGVGNEMIEKLSQKYRATNQEYFSIYKDGAGNPNEHLSPELIEIIKSELAKYTEAPEGWKTAAAVSLETGNHYRLVKKTAERYSSNKDYFHDYKDVIGTVREHYSPELIELITRDIKTGKEEIQNYPEAPIGWKTRQQLIEDLHAHARRIEAIVNKYRDSNQEYFAKFKITRGTFERVYEHYSPELVEIIKQEIRQQTPNIQQAPENWQTVQNISEKTGISDEEIEKIAKKLRKKYQDQHGRFRDKNI